MSNSASASGSRPRAALDSVSLLDLGRELGLLLTDEERDGVAAIRLPTRTFGKSRTSLITEFEETEAFGAIVIAGILVHEVRLGDRTGMRLLGPGDVLAPPTGSDPFVLGGIRWLPAGPVRLAMFNGGLVLALRRWPRLIVSLYARLAAQLDRLTTQLLICQLPRVEDRVLGMMWLMAENWGKVTPAGTRLPLDLTHETIGMLIGARRPTVSLALRELADRGALVRHESGWLLLQPLTSMGEASVGSPDDQVSATVQVMPDLELSSLGLLSVRPEEAEENLAQSHELLRETVVSLRDQHQRNVARFQARLDTVRATRI